MSSSDQNTDRDQRAAQHATQKTALQQEAEVPTHPNTPQDLASPPPIPPRAPSRSQTPSQSPDLTRTSLPYTPAPFPPTTPARIIPPSLPIPSYAQAMSDIH